LTLSPAYGAVLLLLARLPASAEETVFTKALVAGPVSRSGRTLIHRDPVEAQIVRGAWKPPIPGESVAATTWAELQADTEGLFRGRALSGGYAYVAVPSERDRILILEAAGHSMVYVNGVPRTGDPYSYGYVRLPVELNRGTNHFLFAVGRGQLRARLVEPAGPAALDGSDATLPDLRIGEKTKAWGAVVAINATGAPLKGAYIEARLQGGKTTRTPLPTLLSLGARKVGFRLEGAAPSSPQDVEVELRLLGVKPAPQPLKLKLRVRPPGATYKRTFISGIDGSVQYFAVNPASEVRQSGDGRPVTNRVRRGPIPGTQDPKARPALVLTLHGASVEAIGQADAYAPKSWAHLVAPTNRRPYGFDWEEWGRLDALEVLSHAQAELGTDPRRTYLTGHSMGGHGTWQVGVNYPDLFAAIAPSAGWISFFSYGGGQRTANPDPIEAMIQRSSNPSDTLALSGNYAQQGIYILHGGADDNVPPTEARTMAAKLGAFHHDWSYHEQPGAGHWWSAGDEPGAQCVDWPPIFDLFARRRLPEMAEVRDVRFTTANPEIGSRCHWATIEAQLKPLDFSTITLRYDPIKRRYSGKTENVARLSLDLSHMEPGKPLSVELDGAKLDPVEWPADGRLTLARDGGAWQSVGRVTAQNKGPHRYGTFKAAFNHRFLFVYGTGGTVEENAWAHSKARYDAETFGYRGNGSVDVLPDTEFRANETQDRSVILYGNADTNAAWDILLRDSPVHVRRGSVLIGSKELTGDDLACLFVRPRPDSDKACVAAVSGTGLAGLRLTERTPVFLSGVGIPDWVVLSAKSLSEGAAGVLAAGFFANDWSVGTDFAYR
jgi:dienelactone hydrolase